MTHDDLEKLYRGHVARRGSGDRSRCVPAERLQEIVDRVGKEAERLESLNHVMACPYCLPEFELLRSVHEAVPVPRPGMRWMAIAASIVLLLGATLIGRRLLTPREDVLRDSPAIGLIAPGQGEHLRLPATFRWHQVAGAADYRLELLTPDGTPAFSAATTDTTLVLDSLPAGDLIWQVSAAFSTGEPARSRPLRLTIEAP